MIVTVPEFQFEIDRLPDGEPLLLHVELQDGEPVVLGAMTARPLHLPEVMARRDARLRGEPVTEVIGA